MNVKISFFKSLFRRFVPYELRYLAYQFRWCLLFLLQVKWKRSQILGRAILLRLKEDLRLIWNNEKIVECPACGWRGNSFFVLTNLGYSMWREEICPKCNCLGRHRLLLTYLQRQHNVGAQPWTILEVAPTEGLQSYFQRLPDVRYTSIDLISPRAMLKMDITDLKFPSNTFDLIICFHVLEHVRDDLAAISELRRVLKNTGLAIIDVPIDWKMPQTIEFVVPENEHGHYRLYGMDFLDRLRWNGFTTTIDDYASRMNPQARKLYGIPDIRLILARKAAEVLKVLVPGNSETDEDIDDLAGRMGAVGERKVVQYQPDAVGRKTLDFHEDIVDGKA